MAEQNRDDGPFTYAELGERLGLSADGARTRAKRQGWQVVRGNDGRARVVVSPAELPEQIPVKPGQPAEQHPVKPGQEPVTPERLIVLTARAQAAEQAAELWRSKAEQNGREAERERGAAEVLRDQLARAERQIDERDAELRELRRPWLVRVVAALRRG